MEVAKRLFGSLDGVGMNHHFALCLHNICFILFVPATLVMLPIYLCVSIGNMIGVLATVGAWLLIAIPMQFILDMIYVVAIAFQAVPFLIGFASVLHDPKMPITSFIIPSTIDGFLTPYNANILYRLAFIAHVFAILLRISTVLYTVGTVFDSIWIVCMIAAFTTAYYWKKSGEEDIAISSPIIIRGGTV